MDFSGHFNGTILNKFIVDLLYLRTNDSIETYKTNLISTANSEVDKYAQCYHSFPSTELLGQQ